MIQLMAPYETTQSTSISTTNQLWMDIPSTSGELPWTTGPEGSKLPWKTVCQLFALSVRVVSVFLLTEKDNFKLSRGYNVHLSVASLLELNASQKNLFG